VYTGYGRKTEKMALVRDMEWDKMAHLAWAQGMYNCECRTLGIRLIFLYIFRDVQQIKAKKFNDFNTVKIDILHLS